VEAGERRVLAGLRESYSLDAATFSATFEALLASDAGRAESFFQEALAATAETGARQLYQLALLAHCRAGDLAGVQRRRDEALLQGMPLPRAVHAPVLGLLRARGEVESAQLFVREQREAGLPLCEGAALAYAKLLVGRQRHAALAELLDDLAEERLLLHDVRWPRAVLGLIACLLSLPGTSGEHAVALGRKAELLAEKARGCGAVADEAKACRRLMELYMAHDAPEDAARVVERYLLLQAQVGFEGEVLAGVVSEHLAAMMDALVRKGHLTVAVGLARALCRPAPSSGALPDVLPDVMRDLLYHMRYVKEKGPEVAAFLLDTALPAIRQVRPKGYFHAETVDKCLYNALCVSHSLPNAVSLRVLDEALEHYRDRTISSRLVKTLLCSAAHAPSLAEGTARLERMVGLRWDFRKDRERVGLSHGSYAHLTAEQMVAANRRCFLHFYSEALELVAKTRACASHATVRFMLHLLREMEQQGPVRRLPDHVVLLQDRRRRQQLKNKEKQRRVPFRKRSLLHEDAPQLQLSAGEDPLPHMRKPPGVTAWDYRNVMLVASELDYLEALLYASTMAHEAGLLDVAIDLLPPEYRNIRAKLRGLTASTSSAS